MRILAVIVNESSDFFVVLMGMVKNFSIIYAFILAGPPLPAVPSSR
jgi:hypothetical protein